MTAWLKYWHWAAIVGLATFAGVEWHLHNVAEQQRGAAVVLNHQYDSTLKSIKQPLATVETLLVHDKRTVPVLATRVVTKTDTVLRHLTDTVLVKQYVTTADSAAKACVESINHCNEYKRLTDIKINTLESKLAVAPLLKPQHHLGADLLWFTLGALGGYVAHR